MESIFNIWRAVERGCYRGQGIVATLITSVHTFSVTFKHFLSESMHNTLLDTIVISLQILAANDEG